MRSIFVAILLFAASAAAASPFADSVVDYHPGPGQWVNNSQYNDPTRALGRPYGAGVSVADNTSVVTLGDGGTLTLAFSDPVTDDPNNPEGYDFIVFSNSIWVGGDPTYRWQELAYVEISQNGTDWYLMLPSILPSQLAGGVDTGQSYTVVRNYAEYTPTMLLPADRTPEEYYCVPDRQSVEGDDALLDVDAVSGGGDAFDIATAVRESVPGVPLLDTRGNTIPAGISWFRYIRITDAVVGDAQGSLGEVSAEIDAVADVSPAETVGQAKQKTDGEFTVIKDAVVTAVFPGEVFVREEDRSASIRILTSDPVTVGDTLIVTGHLSTVSGERIIADPLVTVLSSGSEVKPLGMSSSGISQNAAGLVRTWGRVKESGADWFTIDDGSGPVKVVSGFLMQPTAESFVCVTGIAALEGPETVLEPRAQDDIQMVE